MADSLRTHCLNCGSEIIDCAEHEVAETPVALRWADEALCRGKTELFFPPPGERSGRRRKREAIALAYCSQCPVSDPCKEAGRGGREHGFWGGESDEDRSEAGYGPSHPHRKAVGKAKRTSDKRASARRATEKLRTVIENNPLANKKSSASRNDFS